MPENSCYTYFAIKGEFNPDDITRRIDLNPSKVWKKGDKRNNGTEYDFSYWEFGFCDEYDVVTEKQMQKTLEPLFSKIAILNEIRKESDVVFVLEIVPTVYSENATPCLAPSMEVIDFCHETRTGIDIDLYVGEKE
jgi:hypothetical protein